MTRSCAKALINSSLEPNQSERFISRNRCCRRKEISVPESHIKSNLESERIIGGTVRQAQDGNSQNIRATRNSKNMAHSVHKSKRSRYFSTVFACNRLTYVQLSTTFLSTQTWRAIWTKHEAKLSHNARHEKLSSNRVDRCTENTLRGSTDLPSVINIRWPTDLRNHWWRPTGISH